MLHGEPTTDYLYCQHHMPEPVPCDMEVNREPQGIQSPGIFLQRCWKQEAQEETGYPCVINSQMFSTQTDMENTRTRSRMYGWTGEL
ncbi:hypothetical protein DPEC_G00327220 [Dallia pectoralis]|uniref:Uncharacterized protein n=1 Tax=Dallia pectoralis TaxID=75939 RepID=A0ACC2F833_DALPE|nr:hypothetical protein DPEC_G00327220 [Dallia pectoralis]